MKRVTASDVELELYKLTAKHIIPELNSTLKSSIRGGVYYDGSRPSNSTNEDLVISFASAINGQFTRGVIILNLFIPNIDPGPKEVAIKDVTRVAELERVMQQFSSSLPVGEYLFEEDSTIQSYQVPDIKQYYINLRLKFSYNGG